MNEAHNYKPEEKGPHKSNLVEYAQLLSNRSKPNPLAPQIFSLIQEGKGAEKIQEIFIKHLDKLAEFKIFCDKFLNLDGDNPLPVEIGEKYEAYRDYFEPIGFNIGNFGEIEQFKKNLDEVLIWCEGVLDLEQAKLDNPDTMFGLENVFNREFYLEKFFTKLAALENAGNVLARQVGGIAKDLLSIKRKSITEVRHLIETEIIPAYRKANYQLSEQIKEVQIFQVQKYVEIYLNEVSNTK